MVNAGIVLQLDVASTIKDVDAEIKKIRTKLQKSQAAAKKQQELMSTDGFEKASEVVVQQEKKKLNDALAANDNYEKTIAEFEKLKIGS